MKVSTARTAVSGLLIVAGLSLSACHNDHPGRWSRHHPHGDHDRDHDHDHDRDHSRY